MARRNRSRDDKKYYGVKVKLDPTPRQERMLNSHAGAARFAYNWALDRMKSQIEDKVNVDKDAKSMR